MVFKREPIRYFFFSFWTIFEYQSCCSLGSYNIQLLRTLYRNKATNSRRKWANNAVYLPLPKQNLANSPKQCLDGFFCCCHSLPNYLAQIHLWRMTQRGDPERSRIASKISMSDCLEASSLQLLPDHQEIYKKYCLTLKEQHIEPKQNF